MSLVQKYLLADIERYAARHEALSRYHAAAKAGDEDGRRRNRELCEAEHDKAQTLRAAKAIIADDAKGEPCSTTT